MILLEASTIDQVSHFYAVLATIITGVGSLIYGLISLYVKLKKTKIELQSYKQENEEQKRESDQLLMERLEIMTVKVINLMSSKVEATAQNSDLHFEVLQLKALLNLIKIECPDCYSKIDENKPNESKG